jgi:hypothetical protein
MELGYFNLISRILIFSVIGSILSVNAGSIIVFLFMVGTGQSEINSSTLIKVPGYMIGAFGAIMAAFVLLIALPLNELFMYSAYLAYLAQDINPTSKLNH